MRQISNLIDEVAAIVVVQIDVGDDQIERPVRFGGVAAGVERGLRVIDGRGNQPQFIGEAQQCRALRRVVLDEQHTPTGQQVAALEIRIAGFAPYDVPLEAAEDVSQANLLQRIRNAVLGWIA